MCLGMNSMDLKGVATKMATYKKFCIYCNQLIPGDSQICPICEKENPFSMRCPKCSNPIQKNWKICSSCGIKLVAVCTKCGRETATAFKCEHCGAPVLVKCSNRKCLEIQILTKERKCIRCGNKL